MIKRDLVFLLSIVATLVFAIWIMFFSLRAAAQEKRPTITIGNTECGKAITPALQLLLAAGQAAEAEKASLDVNWYSTIIGGNLALIDVFTKSFGAKKVPGVFAWQAVRGLILYILSHMDYQPGGKSAALTLQAIAKVNQVDALCAKESARSKEDSDKKNNNSVSL